MALAGRGCAFRATVRKKITGTWSAGWFGAHRRLWCLQLERWV